MANDVCRNCFYAKTFTLYETSDDYVKVVRCKGCKYWDEDQYGCKCSFHSQKENEDYPAFEVEMLPNDFCSYGERKDNG